ncbi:MAG: hypothetical protein E5Y52_11415 [Mesorhizobium sp.]|nr:MAG: hypothetical protein E5Y52_11415 [Mesorhizobium sp.]
MSKRSANFISAFEFDVIRNAFWRSVVEDCLPREQWETRAGDLVRSFVGVEAPAEVLAALLDLTEKKEAQVRSARRAPKSGAIWAATVPAPLAIGCVASSLEVLQCRMGGACVRREGTLPGR